MNANLAEALEEVLQHRLGSRVRDLSVGLENGGIVLRGQASTYHAKQLAQHWAMKESQISILANQIEVH